MGLSCQGKFNDWIRGGCDAQGTKLSEEAIGKILGGNLLRVLRQFCQYNLLSPTIESHAFD
jgi:hypothetical protein